MPAAPSRLRSSAGLSCRTWSFLLATLLAGATAGAERDGPMYDPRFREGAPSDELVGGAPRLSRGHVNAYVDLLESAFVLSLGAQLEQELRDAVETEFSTASSLRREAFLSLVEPIVTLRAKGRAGDEGAVREGLRRFRASVDERLRGYPGATSNRLLTRALERRHEVIWVGEPAVKGTSVDAYLELVEFFVSLGRNEALQLSPGRRSALRDYLGRDLADASLPVRERLASVHRTWLRAKARWDHAKDARRFALRWEAVQLLARLSARKPPLEIVPGLDLASYAREAARVADAWDPFDAATALSRNPLGLCDALARGLQFGDEEEPAFTFLYR